jgi:uncharacterized membrane protein
LLAGAGLSSSSGLNAYLPILILALADRIDSGFNLTGRFDAISSNTAIVVILLVLSVELIADKITRLDHMNDILHTAIRPAMGALCFGAIASESGDLNPWVGGVLGLVIAGAVHLWKMRARPAVTAATSGIGNPIISVFEDVVAIVVSIASMALPVVNLLLIPAAGWWLARSYRRMANGESSLMSMLVPARNEEQA